MYWASIIELTSYSNRLPQSGFLYPFYVKILMCRYLADFFNTAKSSFLDVYVFEIEFHPIVTSFLFTIWCIIYISVYLNSEYTWVIGILIRRRATTRGNLSFIRQ